VETAPGVEIETLRERTGVEFRVEWAWWRRQSCIWFPCR